MRSLRHTIICSLIIANRAASAVSEQDFVPLFASGTADGWSVVGGMGGQVQYQLKDNILTGSGTAKHNAFFYSPVEYADFILDVDVMLTRGNSGIQVRSNAEHETPGQPAGRMVGLQVEIDPTDRKWSGGVYDEGRSGWLADLSDDEAARNAFKTGEWNAYHIECIGERIRTSINGVPCADYSPTKERTGRIGFQVHSGDSLVQWRNARIAVIPTPVAPAALKPNSTMELLAAISALTREQRVQALTLGTIAAAWNPSELVIVQDQLASMWRDTSRSAPSRVVALRAICAIPEASRTPDTTKLGFTPIEFICMPGKMAWNIKDAKAVAGAPLEIVMTNADSLQHNLLVCAPGSLMEIGTKGELMGQTVTGKDLGFVPPSPSVLQVMGLIDPDKSGSLFFIAPPAGLYPIVCTYPGHWRTMNARLRVSER